VTAGCAPNESHALIHEIGVRLNSYINCFVFARYLSEMYFQNDDLLLVFRQLDFSLDNQNVFIFEKKKIKLITYLLKKIR
jgi:hypothetical protein